jgi:hypothetical protein
MKRPEIVVYEADRRLAALLAPLAEARGWPLREPKQAPACLRLLAKAGPGVLVVKAGREAAELERGLVLLERAAWLFPDTATVFVGDGDHAALGPLAWGLGADYVLLPPLPRERLPEVVEGLMRREG